MFASIKNFLLDDKTFVKKRSTFQKQKPEVQKNRQKNIFFILQQTPPSPPPPPRRIATFKLLKGCHLEFENLKTFLQRFSKKNIFQKKKQTYIFPTGPAQRMPLGVFGVKKVAILRGGRVCCNITYKKKTWSFLFIRIQMGFKKKRENHKKVMLAPKIKQIFSLWCTSPKINQQMLSENHVSY